MLFGARVQRQALGLLRFQHRLVLREDGVLERPQCLVAGSKIGHGQAEPDPAGLGRERADEQADGLTVIAQRRVVRAFGEHGAEGAGHLVGVVHHGAAAGQAVGLRLPGLATGGDQPAGRSLHRVVELRGVAPQDAAAFLAPQLRDLLPDPLRMKDTGRAAARFLHAVKTRQRIAIFADYDVDGGSSAALLIIWLRAMGRQATLYIPDRIDEGYGPNGVAVIVETMTDNHKRTVADVRHAFTKAGGSLGTSGSVAYLFTRRGVLVFAPGVDEDALMEAALEAGADDIVTDADGSVEVFTAPDSFSDVKDAMAAAGFVADSGEVTLVPATRAEVDADHVAAFFKMLDQLEDSDDVQNVYHNADISDELMAAHG